MKKETLLCTASLMLATFAPLREAHAAENLWNNGSSNFVWDLTSANWTAPMTWAEGDDAIFGSDGAGLVTLGAPITVHNQTFNAAGYTIAGAGNSLTLAGTTPTITVNADGTNAASLYGTDGLTIQGTGVLTLQGDTTSVDGNHYTGGTFVRSGTLVLAVQGASSDGSSYGVDSIEALDAGATLVIPGSFDGTSWVSVRDQIATSLPESRLRMTGGTLDMYDDPKNQRIPVPDGTGLITNTGSNVQSGLIMVADGLNHEFSGVIADGNNGVLVGDNNPAGDTPQGPGYQIGIVSFAGQKNGGGGLWILSGPNTYSGSTRIDQGASIKLDGNGTIGFPTASLSLTGPLRIYGSASDPARGYLDLNGHNQTIALMQNGNADAKIFNSAVGTVSTLTIGYGNEQAARTCSFQLMDNQGTGGILALKKVATGPAFILPSTGLPATNCAQTLSGVNTYSGDTTVEGGHLIMAAASAVSPFSAFRLSTTASQPSPDSSVSLVLSYEGTANVRQLWIDGVQQPNGVYGAGTPGIDPDSTGTLTVTGYSAPPTLAVSQNGNTLTFTWTGSYLLQAQTNSLTGTWHAYPGGHASPVAVIIDPVLGSVYFRLSE